MSLPQIVALSAAIGAVTALWAVALLIIALAVNVPRILAALGRQIERWAGQAL